MLSVSEALAIVVRHAQPLPADMMPLSPAALGLVLAEDVVSDLDMPPFDKALMDGYALRSADVSSGTGNLTVVGEVTAGQTPAAALAAGQALRIMTGAPLPIGADAVVPIEQTELIDEHHVLIRSSRLVRAGDNILLRGREMRRGEVVLTKGTVLRPQELGVLATVGHTALSLQPVPVVAVLSTGDELVDAYQKPGPGQIRNGNAPMLQAQVARAGGQSLALGIARDRLDSLQTLISEGLRASLLVLSGGVSAGTLDLVPKVLHDLGVEAHFHKVAIKPGKPIFFGSRGSTLVFGLPGNPVSAFVCFELFVRPALRRLRGQEVVGLPFVPATIAADFCYRTDRPTYHPALVETGESGWHVRPVPWFGSTDLRGLALANALLLIEPQRVEFKAGDRVSILRLEN